MLEECGRKAFELTGLVWGGWLVGFGALWGRGVNDSLKLPAILEQSRWKTSLQQYTVV